MSTTPQAAAVRELAKVQIGFKMLQSGTISMMSEVDFQKFIGWLA